MKLPEQIAKIVSVIFHPLIIPTLGTILLLNSGFYFSEVTLGAKIIITAIVVLSTFITPLISLLIMSRNENFSLRMEKSTDRVLPLLFTAIYYYIGYFFMGRVSVYPVFRAFIISSILIIALLLLISMKWKISAHMAGIGGLLGVVIALSLRLYINNSLMIALLIVATGMVGAARLILEKHTPAQIYVGFLLGFGFNFFVFSFL